MATNIEWARNEDGTKGETWNPTVGCSRVSPGCDGCYAIGVAHRAMQPAHEGLTHRRAIVDTDGGQVGEFTDWTGEVRELPDRLDTPFGWRKPRRVFVDSMSDLFLADDDFMARVWAVMALTPQHTYQVLTKRHRALQTLDNYDWRYKVGLAFWSMANRHGIVDPERVWPLPNVQVGVSVENQRYADLRIPHLLATPAAVRFLSIEPLLGPVDITDYIEPDWIGSAAGGSGAPHPLIDWVIVGGESGPGARPMHPQWVHDIRDQCTAAGVPFFFKQWGSWTPFPHEAADSAARTTVVDPNVGVWNMARVGKKAAGRELDGRTWDEMPA